MATPDSPAGGTGQGAAGGDQVSSGVDRIRETAKWLVAGFGALGGALITSLQLSNLSQVTGSHRVVALIGFGLGIGGVLLALVAAASVLAAVRVSLADLKRQDHLREYIRSNPELLGGFPSLEALSESYDSLARMRVESYSDLLAAFYRPPGIAAKAPPQVQAGAAPAGQLADGVPAEEVSDSKTLGKIYEFTEKKLTLVNPPVSQVLAAGTFEKIRYRWVHLALPGILAGVIIAAAGAGLFAAQASTSGSTTAATQTEALIQLTPAGEHQFGAELGPGCGPADVPVLVLDQFATGWRLETMGDNCRPLTFNASAADVIMEAEVQPCPLPSASSTSTPSPSPPPAAGSGPAPAIRVC